MNRFLKKIEKDESFLDCAISLSSMMEEKVRQNNAVEIYTDYFQVAFLTLISSFARPVLRRTSFLSSSPYVQPL